MSVTAPSSRTAEITLAGHLTERSLELSLTPVAARLDRDTPSLRLVLDCRRVTGYDGEARSFFVQWNRKHRRRIERVAIITDNALYRMVISAMALASQQEMRAFRDHASARVWAEEVAAVGAR